MMSIEQAAARLQERLSGVPWFTAVGTGEHEGAPRIYLYVKSLKHAELNALRDGWEGYPVEIRKMGTIRTAATHPQGE
jgi:hypothetical protein